MRLVSFEIDGRRSFGAAVDGGIADLGARFEGRFRDLRDALDQDALGALGEAAAGAAADLGLDDVRFLPPIPYPEKIYCIGVNYANRNEEYRDGRAPSKYPNIFMRAPDSLVGHREPIVRPPESEQLDYEGEIALIIGRRGRRIAEGDAPDHVAGMTCMNEGTLRDWLRHGSINVTQGKNFDRSGSIGPWLVTRDEADPFGELRVRTRVNGETRQDDTTANIIFPFRFLIAYVSTFTTLKPGDVIATGTPTGAGARLDPPVWLKPGDRLEVEVSGVGVLENTVIEEG